MGLDDDVCVLRKEIKFLEYYSSNRVYSCDYHKGFCVVKPELFKDCVYLKAYEISFKILDINK